MFCGLWVAGFALFVVCGQRFARRKVKGDEQSAGRLGGKGAERQLVAHSSKVKGLEAGKQGSGKGELNIFD